MDSSPRSGPERGPATDPEEPHRPSLEHGRRDRRTIIAAFILSLLFHVALFLAAGAWVVRNASVPAPPEVMSLVFVDAPPVVRPALVPPPTNVIAEQSALAEAPAPGRPPEPAPGPMAVPSTAPPPPPPPETRPPVERRPPPPERPPDQVATFRQPPAPDEAPSEEGTEEPSPDEKRARLEQALRHLGEPSRSWGESMGREGSDLAMGGGGTGSGGGDSFQFESRADVDWGPYAARIKPIVRGNWIIPGPAQIGLPGIVQVHFFIRRDGTIEELRVVSGSSTPALDVAAENAISLSNKLPPPPLPPDDPEERVGVTWTFFYNIDDAAYRQWDRGERLRRRQARD